ncbi:MAG TPA: stage II sporulation protein R [Syntrophomonadaceae bacterium]|nr:stage II sporulation protein R [Syntrophomonadaceae bacterium]HQE23120.1 stage II sporulation protein R [Syntrophomonadaceae bacterium]
MKKWLYVVLLLSVIMGSFWWNQQQQIPLQDSVLRLHVIANSDSLADQALKMEVKNRIVEVMQSEFSTAASKQEAWDRAVRNKAVIEKTARQVVADWGYSYPVKVEMGEYQFPTKTYGNLVLPQGNYEAVRVVIGQGQGQNWWCVLFPPLCMVSSSDEGLSLGNSQNAQITLKCLELLPQGARISRLYNQNQVQPGYDQP